ncbi:hypothetical protein CC1G_05635 [Coprinopsis cinerea okayama7|uniref:Uncharacterized protein n=1 Tax=Coprinopsis cinerea (strain Okayama-7 / 130 / ATCC MYA-4618 / FGSC 9003) TaxID=240176 RepID=A8P1Q7_COPC7|nr:hypothetical protein CC1G_05635 [Coprinopsis cinerea okayama7\|eukprot:XP_001838154.2 hypothetical protein CC1G_05635 [Coprinopsis cinerea okayama7\
MNSLKIAYLVTRYSIFIHYILTLVSTSIANSACADALLHLQVYAFSGRSRIIGTYLLIQYSVEWGLKFGYFAQNIRRAVFVISDLPGLHCMDIKSLEVVSSMHILFIIPIPALVLLIAITFYIYRERFRGLRSSLLVVFIRNGMIYVLVILVLTIVTVIINETSNSAEHTGPMSAFQGAFHPLLASRMILHLREEAHKESTVLVHANGHGQNRDLKRAVGVDDGGPGHSLPPIRFANQALQTQGSASALSSFGASSQHHGTSSFKT